MSINDLHKAARAGDKEAEGSLFQLLSVRFQLLAKRKLGNRSDYQDVVQDALSTIFNKYRDVEFESSFSVWAYNVLINNILNYNAKHRRHHAKHLELAEKLRSDTDFAPEPDFEKRLLECFHKIHKHNSLYARIINLSYQGFTVKDICKKLGYSANRFYAALSRSRAMLNRCLKKGTIK